MVTSYIDINLQSRFDSFQLDASFSANKGIVVLFGPSGCGKSTILNCIAGLHIPDRGTIRIGDVLFFDSTSSINLTPQKRRVGYVFQQCALFPHLNVRQNITFGISKWIDQEQSSRLDYLVALLKLEGLTERQCNQLSGGQIQRVALARALAPKPELLLLDEPFNALDSELRSTLGEELKRLSQLLSLPAIFVTHSAEEANRIAGTIVHMNAGMVQSQVSAK